MQVQLHHHLKYIWTPTQPQASLSTPEIAVKAVGVDYFFHLQGLAEYMLRNYC